MGVLICLNSFLWCIFKYASCLVEFHRTWQIQYSSDIKFICVPFDHRVPMQLCRSSILAIVPLLYGLQQHMCHLGQRQLWVGRWLWPVQSTFELQNLGRIGRRACGLKELFLSECTVSGRGQTLTVRKG